MSADIHTVFILGAGASMPYGFPSGKQLATEIQKGGKVLEVARALGRSTRDVDRFCRDFKGSRLRSIDAYVGFHEDQVDAAIGAALVAHHLIDYERAGGPQVEDPDKDWYEEFWTHISEGTHREEVVVARLRRYRFFTFNYDRSFEEFLIEAGRKTLRRPRSEIAEIFAPVLPVHLYGQLGSLPSEQLFHSPPYRQYGQNDQPYHLQTAREQIKLIPALRGAPDEFKALQSALLQCKVLAFLGFGFDRTNCERIDIPAVINERKLHNPDDLVIVGTTYGMVDNEQRQAEEKLGHKIAGKPVDCRMFLRVTGGVLC